MSDYISREDALSVFGDIHPLDHNANAYKAQIEKMPSADVRENIHGEWISNEKKGTCFPMWCRYKCSCCGMDADKSDFCPNCGADMRGKQNE